ncbi:MAG: metallophosphoesterase [Candidatus Eiseniibacteriota bacterium]
MKRPAAATLVLALLAFVLLGATEARAVDRTVVPRLSVWRYDVSGADLGTAWRAPGHDDSSWPTGAAILGFGESYITTVLPVGPSPSNVRTTTYFRIAFDVPDDPAEINLLTLGANYDDGFVAYLNGQEITRRGLGTGPVNYLTRADSHEGGTYVTIDVSASAPLIASGPNVLAVEVHQTSATSTDLVWDGELRYSTSAASVTRGPYLQNGTPDAITVRWRTSVPTSSRVLFGSSPGNLTTSVDDLAPTTEHEVRLTGLSPETRYFYAVGSTTEVLSGDDAATWFETAPPAGQTRPVRIWALGDSGLPGAPASRVRDAYDDFTEDLATNVWLMLGDNAYGSGTDAEYQAAVFDQYPAFLRTHVLWPTRGNHDFVYSGGGNDYYDLFTMPAAAEAGGFPSGSEAWYSFDYADVHFVCLDSEGSDRSPAGAMLTWLENDLIATTKSWIIAFWHHPPYTKGSHDSDNVGDSGGRMRDMRENALPILEQFGVDLVLCGHSHSYERSFLLDGHYGTSGTLVPSMVLDAGDGARSGDGAYEKPTPGAAPHEGAVYAVAGSSAHTSGGTLDHAIMVRSLNVLGSLVLDIRGNELDGVFLDDLGAVRDSFAIVKGSTVDVPGVGDAAAGALLELAVRGANPFTNGIVLEWTLPAPREASVTIFDPAGRRVRSLATDTAPEAGPHRATWDGLDAHGRIVPAGVYFGVLEHGGARRVVRLVRAK